VESLDQIKPPATVETEQYIEVNNRG
jgi:hypothetical protein